jgi:hypothetical protein
MWRLRALERPYPQQVKRVEQSLGIALWWLTQKMSRHGEVCLSIS